jgi:nicotinamide mononucleotide (NMN) deamidase PncC
MSTFTHFVQNYNGPKVAILATGGGMSLANLGTIPGASRVLHSFYCPYETEETIQFLRANHPAMDDPDHKFIFETSAVSPGACLELYQAMAARYPNANVIAVTAACTSTRWRRGENRAYVACKSSDGVVEVWHLKMPKATQDEHAEFSANDILLIRGMEDQGIGNAAMALAGNINTILEGLKADGTITLCNP